MGEPSCPAGCPCWLSPDGAFLLANIERYLPTVQVHVARCPRCGMTQEFRVAAEGIELGYCYAAGSLHFAGMQVLPVAGLSVGEKGSVWLDCRLVWQAGASS